MKPLQGIKVVELANYVAAPTCARILGDWGADVIKVEGISGDIWRKYGKNFGVPATDEENPVFDVANANKRFVSVNLKTPEGMEIMHRLLSEADVFVTNNRPAPLAKMGLDYETLKEKYPRLIYALITGFGEVGPDAGKPGFDTVAFWASGGFMADMRIDTPGSYPIYAPAGIADISCGTMLFGGISAALYARERTGRGDKVSISLFGTAVWTMGIMDMIAQDKYNYKYPKTRYVGKPTVLPYQCGDGEWIMISILEYERYFPVLCKLLNMEDLLDDPRCTTEAEFNKDENRKFIIQRMENEFRKRSYDEWDVLFSEADIVHDKLAHYRDIHKSEQVRVNHFMEELTFANGSTAWLPRPSLVSDQLGLPPYELSRPIGADTEAVLSDLNYSREDICSLESQQVIRMVEAKDL